VKLVMKFRYKDGMWPHIVLSGEVWVCLSFFITGRGLSAVAEGSSRTGILGRAVACLPERGLFGVSHGVQLIVK
jgi:hypothetical protein